MKFVFLEGYDDIQFFKMLYKNRYDIQYVEYAQKRKKDIDNYIKSINSMPDCEYVFVADSDGQSDDAVVDKLMNTYSNLEKDSMYIVRFEIESWYLAGVSKEYCTENKISKYIAQTDNITKEQFNQILPARKTRLQAMIDILDNYNVELAITRNSSFQIYINNEEPSMAV